MKPLIIVGTGLAAYSLAREFRKLDRNSPLLLISAESGDFYAKPGLSNAFAQGKDETSLINQTAVQMAEQLAATILTHTRVEHIDSARQVLRTPAGEFDYRQLVLATGAQPIRLALQGDASEAVLSVNGIQDYALVREQLRELASHKPATQTQIVILGAGLIGCEFADDFASAGYQISLLDPNPAPLANLTPELISSGLQQALAQRGVNFYGGVSAQAVTRPTSTNRTTDARYRLSLSDGRELDADLVISAVGLRPDLTLAQASGLACQRGVLIDQFGQTSAPQIYALGDVAQYQLDDGSQQCLPYVAPILTAARAMAQTLHGKPSPIKLEASPVIVKTPSYPLAFLHPGPAAAGSWLQTQGEAGISARFIDQQQIVRGFALAPASLAQRKAMLAELGSPLAIHG